MVVDAIGKRGLYHCLGERIEAGLEFLAGVKAASFSERREEIEGDDVFALFQAITTEPAEGRLFEAHRAYIDIQYVLEGEELIRVADVDRMTVATVYDAAKDFALYNLEEGTDVLLRAGDFVILFPHDAHLPKLTLTSPSDVKKVVVKVRAR